MLVLICGLGQNIGLCTGKCGEHLLGNPSAVPWPFQVHWIPGMVLLIFIIYYLFLQVHYGYIKSKKVISRENRPF